MKFQGLNLIIVWISFLVTIVGIIFSFSLISMAKGGVLISFTKWLAAGILLFSIHHALLVLTGNDMVHHLTSYMDTVTIIFFLVGSIILARTLQKII